MSFAAEGADWPDLEKNDSPVRVLKILMTRVKARRVFFLYHSDEHSSLLCALHVHGLGGHGWTTL